MAQQLKYKVIAGFLLIVFSLNTIAGFACSIGIDMGYNTEHGHGQKDKGYKDHKKSHLHGSKHKHTEKSEHKHNHQHKHQNHTAIAKFSGISDDCCADQVNNFARLDKLVPVNNFVLKVPVTFITLIPIILLTDQTKTGLSVNSRFQFVRRSCSLYDIDIRIAIQSFQI